MLKINDHVVFGATGVCKVVDIIRENFGGNTEREYYVLSPVYANSSTIYVPTDNENVVMRKMMTREEIKDLIKAMPGIESEWISEDQSRKAQFNDILQSGDPWQVAHLIKMIYERKVELENIGKRLSHSDTETLKAAEKLLHNEFALALHIEPDQVVPFILGKIDSNQIIHDEPLSQSGEEPET